MVHIVRWIMIFISHTNSESGPSVISLPSLSKALIMISGFRGKLASIFAPKDIKDSESISKLLISEAVSIKIEHVH